MFNPTRYGIMEFLGGIQQDIYKSGESLIEAGCFMKNMCFSKNKCRVFKTNKSWKIGAKFGTNRLQFASKVHETFGSSMTHLTNGTLVI